MSRDASGWERQPAGKRCATPGWSGRGARWTAWRRLRRKAADETAGVSPVADRRRARGIGRCLAAAPAVAAVPSREFRGHRVLLLIGGRAGPPDPRPGPRDARPPP